jgi:two-component system response regulator FixJ
MDAKGGAKLATVLDDDRCVFVIDDDDDMRDALCALFRTIGFRAQPFAQASAFLDLALEDPAGCVVADVRMPGIDGLAFLRQLKEQQVALPVILVSGYADVALSVAAMREGAFSFLTKPFREQEMLETVTEALAYARTARAQRIEERAMAASVAALDARERAIMVEVANGTRNKVIAAQLGLSEVTIKVLRARIMAKMGVDSAARLARIAERLGIR